METLSKILGHTSIKTTQIYGRILDARISEDMSDLKSRLEGKKSTHKKLKTGKNKYHDSL